MKPEEPTENDCNCNCKTACETGCNRKGLTPLRIFLILSAIAILCLSNMEVVSPTTIQCICFGIGLPLSLWISYKHSKGHRLRALIGLLCTFFTVAGAFAVYHCINIAIDFIQHGGAAWFGGITMICSSLIGLIFIIVFGYLLLRIMTARLWHACAYFCMFILIIGSLINTFYQHSEIMLCHINKAENVLPISEIKEDELIKGMGYHVQLLQVEGVNDEKTEYPCILRNEKSRECTTIKIKETISKGNWEIELTDVILNDVYPTAYLTFTHKPGQFWILFGLIGYIICLIGRFTSAKEKAAKEITG